MEYDYSTSGQADPVMTTIMVIIWLAIAVLLIASMWKMFTKAGEKGWASIIPFYNAYVEFRIAGLNPWLFLLLLIPFVNVIVSIWVSIKLGTQFGKSIVWSIFLLILFPFIGYPMLGFGSATYQPVAAPGSIPPPPPAA